MDSVDNKSVLIVSVAWISYHIIRKCGMKLQIHPQTLTMQVISSHTL